MLATQENTALKPIQTYYKGYHFRSRLEARWAVFFDEMHMKWEYEKQGYDLGDGLYYLPDFYLPEANNYVEVKGEEPDGDDLEKILRFSSQNSVILVVGLPEYKSYPMYQDWDFTNDGEKSGENPPKHGREGWSVSFLWWHGEIGNLFCPLFFHGEYYMPDIEDYDGGKELLEACNKAKQARFEHGETPK
jgi:hypothetical protein